MAEQNTTKKRVKQQPVEEKEVIEVPVQKESEEIVPEPQEKKQLAAEIRPLYPSAGFRSPYFQVFVGEDRIYVGSRSQAYKEACKYNQAHGLDVPLPLGL